MQRATFALLGLWLMAAPAFGVSPLVGEAEMAPGAPTLEAPTVGTTSWRAGGGQPERAGAATLPAPPALEGLPADAVAALAGDRYVVGFRGLPRDLEPGDLWNGAVVVSVNRVLHHAAMVTPDPTFPSRVGAADSQGDVRYVEPDPVRQLLRYTPDDPRFADQYGPQQIRGPEAWDTTLGDADANANVCIVDTGVRHTHEDLTGARWLGGHDFINGDANPADDNGHGTHVAGTAAAGLDNAKHIAGMGNVGVYGVKVLDNQGGGTWTQVADGITWCADNAGLRTVVSMSLGGAAGNQALLDAVNYAHGQGLLLVAAAGNDGPCSDCVNYPGAYENVIAVTCTDSDEVQCNFSSDGPESDLAAPGSGILSLWYTSDTATNTISGTSMSTPHVSGVAALVWSQATGLTNANLRAHLEDEAQDLGATGWDELYGHGEVDAKASLDAATGVAPPAEERVSYEDFDDGAADGWTLGGLWHVSDACSAPPSAPNYLGYNQDADCEYSTGGTTSGTADFDVGLAGATAATLNIQHRWETESYAGGAYDVMRIQASSDGGATFNTLKQWDSRDANQLAWGAFSVDLDAYAGAEARIRFSFDSVDGSFNNFEGWFLDNVEVTSDAGGAANQPPTAAAGPDQTKSDADGSGAESATLDGTGSTDSDGTITAYEWKEGATVLATTATATVSFGVGAHTVTLTVTDDDGATASDTVVVTVNANQAPTAAYTYSCDGLACSFNGAGSSDPDGTISTYSWTFGDGGSASGSGPSHTYAAEGTYTVTLTVTDNGGATDAEAKSVTVNAGPTLIYGMDFDDGAAGWTKSNANDLWHVAGGCLGYASAAKSLQYNRGDANCNYATGARVTGWARSPAIDASGYTTTTLKFRHAFEKENYAAGEYDIMRVQVSGDDGATWTTVKQWDSQDANQLAFVQVEFDVSAYDSGTFRIRYFFDSVDGTDNGYDGWHVDDVELWGE